MFTVSIAFFGDYRPLHFSANTLEVVVTQAKSATATAQGAGRIGEWLDSCAVAIMRPNHQRTARECGQLSVSIARRPHDPWLDSVTAKLLPLPGADYSAVINQ